jgi:uncharacterized membrane protein (DUF106 family)
MESVLDIITRVMVWLGNLAFGLLSVFSPTVGLWIISALTGVGMLLIWRYTSNQDAIADVRAKISAHLLATRLFKDNLSVTFRAQRQIIWQAIRLLGYSVRPMLIMLVPFVLVMVQIGLRYEFRPIAVGELARVTATLKSGATFTGVESTLKLPEGLRQNANDPCRAVALGTVDWRLSAAKPGHYTLAFGAGDDIVEVPLEIGDGFERLSAVRGGGFLDRLLYSAEPSIVGSSVFESIKIHYASRSTPIFGWDVHWLITLFVLSIVFALIFKPILKVNI